MRHVTRASPDRVAASIREAANLGVTLDYSAGSAEALARLIAEWEHMARVAADLDDAARVSDQVGSVLDLPALGTYYGELFVRHAGAAWGEAEGEDGLEPAVTRGGVTLLPLDAVRRRVYDGPHVDLAQIFQQETAAMTRR